MQFIRLQLRHQANAPAFLLLVDKDARAFSGNHRQGHLKLLAAITAQRAEHITGQTLRMNAYQRWDGVNVAHDQRDRLFRFAVLHRLKLETTSRGLLVIATLLVPLNFVVMAGLAGQEGEADSGRML